MPVSEQTYRELAEQDFESGWELVCGELRKKPAMTMAHNTLASVLTFDLQRQLPLDDYRCSHNQARLRVPGGSHYVPDVVVIPSIVVGRHLGETTVETYDEPLPLVVEVWSPSTGDYDVETKLRDYQPRGDLEIWRIDPRDRSITSWARQADGGYAERRHAGGMIRPVAFTQVVIDLGQLFGRARL